RQQPGMFGEMGVNALFAAAHSLSLAPCCPTSRQAAPNTRFHVTPHFASGVQQRVVPEGGVPQSTLPQVLLPLGGRRVHTEGLAFVHRKPLSAVQVVVQPSSECTLPSSQASLPSRTPSPHLNLCVATLTWNV